MRLHLVMCVAVGSMLSASAASAQTIYFSVGNQIRTLTLGVAGSQLVHQSNALVGDLALCADDKLFYVETGLNRISRLDLTQGAATVIVNASDLPTPTLETPRELRLTNRCGLRFATASGVWSVDDYSVLPVVPSSISKIADASAGSGLASAFDGSLRHSDGNTIRAESSAAALSQLPTSIVGLGVSNGAIGSVLPGAPIGAVCASSSTKIDCVNGKSGEPLLFSGQPLASFALAGSTATELAQYWEFLTNDQAIAATSVNPAQGLGGNNNHNGLLWLVSPPAAPQVIFAAPKANGSYSPIVGVAVGPSGKKATDTARLSHSFPFGPVLFEATTANLCSLAVEFRQLRWADALRRVNSVVPSGAYQIDPALGEESWVVDFDVEATPASGFTDCGHVKFALSEFLSNSFVTNRAVLQCETTDDSGNPIVPRCTATTEGNLPLGAAPGDETDTGSSDNFGSDYLTAIVADSSTKALLPGFDSPLNNLALVPPVGAAQFDAALRYNSFRASTGVPFKFRLCDLETCTQTVAPDVPNWPFAGALLAVQAISRETLATSSPCTVQDAGASTPGNPVFRVSGSSHVFNLKLPMAGPAECGQPGYFVATVSSLDGRFDKKTILFFLR